MSFLVNETSVREVTPSIVETVEYSDEFSFKRTPSLVHVKEGRGNPLAVQLKPTLMPIFIFTGNGGWVMSAGTEKENNNNNNNK